MSVKIARVLFFILLFSISAWAQTETLTNASVIEMTKVGLDKELILEKIKISKLDFDTSINGLIELRKAGVENDVIKVMMENVKQREGASAEKAANESKPAYVLKKPVNAVPTAKEALLAARTVAIEKDSIHPSIQALEKELMKRKEWAAYNLTLVRSRNEADIYIEIDFVKMSVITHRYTFRVYDRRNGTIIAAGETTSWGSLAENLAREISKKLKIVAEPPPVQTAKAN
jgi:hypothetical protein